MKTKRICETPKESMQTVRIGPKCQQIRSGREREAHQGKGRGREV